MSVSTISAIALVSLAPFLVVIVKTIHGPKGGIKAPNPPGPTRLPLTGSLLQMPSPTGKKAHWRVYKVWKEKYSDLIYLEAAGQKLLILNCPTSIDALLNKRATKYSDRFRHLSSIYVAHDPHSRIRPRWSFAFLDYNTRWQDHLIVSLGQQSYYPTPFVRLSAEGLGEKSLRLPKLSSLLPSQKKLIYTISGYVSSQISNFRSISAVEGEIRFSGAYEHMVWDRSESTSSHGANYARSLIRDSDTLITQQPLAFQPGRYLVGFVPWLKHAPSWFPGAIRKRKLESIGELSDRVRSGKQGDLEALMATPNVATELIEGLPDINDETYAHKEELARTQVKIDAELGGQGRPLTGLPNCKDLEQLPYISAIVKEVGRWHTVLPLEMGFADHGQRKVFLMSQGMTTFMKGTIYLLAQLFSQIPDQNGDLDSKVLGPDDAAFGYGRSLLRYDITPALDEKGRPKGLSLEVSTSSISVPLPFEVVLTPRSEVHINLVQAL
ncbi:hypothetical protein BKA70DRAFT_1233417 [Coprinopsis sp. MPI-PUGE-AT-0042]|nr:hypothetical protein BKA70DRAFT_1233417 [Coprinopsis sp. MPI-PUGE-AT-0042]